MWNDQWHMLAGTYDGATVRLYLDGTEVGSTPAMGNIAYNLASTNDFVIGTLKDPACVEQTNFSGSIDEPRVYSRALTPAEIALLADPSAVTPPELPASYALPLSPKSSCLRREISLVRADVRRRRVVLSGLVQPRFVGQPIRILANYRAAKAGALTRLATVRSNAAGQFKATVRRPARKTFNKARFRAQVDRFRSAPLKLPQSLSSTSIKQVGGQIVLRGKVKRSLLGRRNRVTIKRLVCGRYRTVAGARPGRNGRYVTRFSVPANVAVALFRAETRVLSRPRGRRYVKQYARAISITLTSSTG
jgi:hypothetical protein